MLYLRLALVSLVALVIVSALAAVAHLLGAAVDVGGLAQALAVVLAALVSAAVAIGRLTARR